MGLASPAPEVEVSTKFQLVDNGITLPVPTRMQYASSDPYAVTVIFDAGIVPIRWSFARSLLCEGLDQRAGLGDVRIWPWEPVGGDFLALGLSSPDGTSLFKVPRSTTVRFLRRSFVAVPRGWESSHIDVDSWIRQLLAPR